MTPVPDAGGTRGRAARNDDGRFFVAGGAVRLDAPSYVERAADTELHDALLRMEFTYVLDTRQMGKTSLMARTEQRLRTENGYAVATVDISGLGQGVTPDQWYDSQLILLGRSFHLQAEIEDFVDRHEKLGALDRWKRAIREVILERIASNIVVFVDEIDYVRVLPFPTDEFFAGIREFHSRRTFDPELNRLTFCLLGVATPSDLIRSGETTPFNIGQRIVLTDLSENESSVRVLAQGLSRDEQTAAPMLARVLYWTGGHPYLTQKLCEEVIKKGVAGEVVYHQDASGVDRACRQLYLVEGARAQNDNLAFVAKRLLDSADPNEAISQYARVRRGERVIGIGTDPWIDVLRLSGIVRLQGDRLVVRNRIYHDVFDNQWITRNLTPEEVLRQRGAARRARRRTLAYAGVIVVAVTSVWYWNYRNEQQRQRDEQQRQREANVLNLIEEADDMLESEPTSAVLLAVAASGLAPNDDLRRSAENALHEALSSIGGVAFGSADDANMTTVALSGDARRLVTGSRNTALVWDTRDPSKPPIQLSHETPKSPVTLSSISHDGRWAATVDNTPRVFIWNLGESPGQQVTPQAVIPVEGRVRSLTFSPKGDQLAVGLDTFGVEVWKTAPQIVRTRLPLPRASEHHVLALTFSADLRFLLAGTSIADSGQTRGHVFRWDIRMPGVVAEPQRLWEETAPTEYLAMTFGDDGRWLADHGVLGDVRVRELRAPRAPRASPPIHVSQVRALALSSKGPRLAVAGESDATVTVWNVETGEQEVVLRGHVKPVDALSFGGDVRQLASAAADGARLWDVDDPGANPRLVASGGDRSVDLVFWPNERWVVAADGDGAIHRLDPGQQGTAQEVFPQVPEASGAIPGVLAVSPKGTWLAAGSQNGHLFLWEHPFDGRSALTSLQPFGGQVLTVMFSPDERWLVAGSLDRDVVIWDLESRASSVHKQIHDGAVVSLTFSSDSKWLATGSAKGDVLRWDLRATHPRQTVKLPGATRAAVMKMAFNGSGEQLAAGNTSGQILIWKMAPIGDPRLLKTSDVGAIVDMAFSPDPDRRRLALGNVNGTWVVTDIWDEASSSTQRIDASGRALGFSADGTRLATGTYDRAVYVWDLGSGLQASSRKLSSQQGMASKLLFSPDGSRLAGVVETQGKTQGLLWTIGAADIIRLACRTVSRTSLPAATCGDVRFKDLNCAVCTDAAQER